MTMINDVVVVVVAAVAADVADTVSDDVDPYDFPMGSYGFPMGSFGYLRFLPQPASVQQPFLLQPTPSKGKDKGQGINGKGKDI